MRNLTDQQLRDQLANPLTRRSAFEETVRRYSRPLYMHIRRIVLTHADTDDILQNTFLSAWRNLDAFRGDSKLSTWLYRIAHNHSIDHLRQHRARHHLPIDDPAQHTLQTLESDPWFDGDQTQKLLLSAIATLPDRQKEVFQLKYFDELKYSEIAEILQTTEGSLKASYHHAVKKITKYIKEHTTH